MDMAKKFGESMATKFGSNNMVEQGARRSRGGAEAFPREEASQEVYLHVSSRTQTQREELDDLRSKVAELTNIIQHMERQLEETRMRGETQIQQVTQQATLRYTSNDNGR